MKKAILVLLWGVVLAAGIGAVAWFVLQGSGVEEALARKGAKAEKAAKGEQGVKGEGKKPVADVVVTDKNGKAGKMKTKSADFDRFFVTEGMTAAERKGVLEMRKALDEENFEKVRAFGGTLGKSGNPEVRLAYVEAIGYFGEEAMAELTAFMGDRNEEVAGEATDAWQTALTSIEDEKLKLVMAEEAMKILRNPIALDMLGGELTSIDDDVKMFEALIRVINEGNPDAAAKAKELYKDETDEEWAGVEAAEAWLQKKRAEENGEDEDDAEDVEESGGGEDSEAETPGAGDAAEAEDTDAAGEAVQGDDAQEEEAQGDEE